MLLHNASSIFLTIVFGGTVFETLAFWHMDMENSTVADILITRIRMLIKYVVFNVMAFFYWYSWGTNETIETSIHSTSPHTFYVLYYIISLVYLGPVFLDTLNQLTPPVSTWARALAKRNSYFRVWMRFHDPINVKFVGKNVNESQCMSIPYQLFWITMLLFKLIFSYTVEIKPLVKPTRQLHNLSSSEGISGLVTFVLISLRWIPFIMIYMIDMSIWQSIWVAIAGIWVGVQKKLGDVRKFAHIHAVFMKVPDEWVKKMVSPEAKHDDASGTFVARADPSSLRTPMPDSATQSGQATLSSASKDSAATRHEMNYSDVPNRSSHWYRTKSSDSNGTDPTCRSTEFRMQQRKWAMFADMWNEVISQMRNGDLISNQEKSYLEFYLPSDGHQRKAQTHAMLESCRLRLPLFHIAGCMPAVSQLCGDIAERWSSTALENGKRQLERELV
jgi:callose synthase